MRKLIYIASKPNLQIVQNCEAFAAQDLDVELWTAADISPDDYGTQENFLVCSMPVFLFALSVFIAAQTSQAHIYYTRDAFFALFISLFKPPRSVAYEVHDFATRFRWMQRLAVRRAGTIIALTPALHNEMARLGAKRIVVAHNGVKQARFENIPSRIEARRALGWRDEAFIVGCIGADGVQALMAALALVWAQASGFQAALALIGVEDSDGLRAEWQKLGLPPDLFLSSGVVTPQEIPLLLSACDVCALPLPRTEHNTFYASPLRLFEYMAARRALIASDLPAWEDVLTDGEHALLVTASDARELAEALTRLYRDPLLRQTLADNAHAHVMAQYTWETRTQNILKKIFGKK